MKVSEDRLLNAYGSLSRWEDRPIDRKRLQGYLANLGFDDVDETARAVDAALQAGTFIIDSQGMLRRGKPFWSLLFGRILTGNHAALRAMLASPLAIFRRRRTAND